MLGIPGTLLILITQFRINSWNLYGASMNATSFMLTLFHKSVNRKVMGGVAGIIMFFFMLTNVLDWVVIMMKIIGVVVVSCIGVMVTYILAFKKKVAIDMEGEEYRRSHLPKFNKIGILSMVISVVIGYAFLALGGLQGETWAPALALVVSIVATLIFGNAMGLKDYKDQYKGTTLKSILAEDEKAAEARVHCSVCNKYYEANDLELCPHNGETICSICCSENRQCNTLCQQK
jgi:purine-cytosine permease-like protein